MIDECFVICWCLAPTSNPTSCGGSTSSNPGCADYYGNCWCDDACFTYGDCCNDYVQTCKVPVVNVIAPPNGPTGMFDTTLQHNVTWFT